MACRGSAVRIRLAPLTSQESNPLYGCIFECISDPPTGRFFCANCSSTNRTGQNAVPDRLGAYDCVPTASPVKSLSQTRWQRLAMAVTFHQQHEASPAAGIRKSLQAGTLPDSVQVVPTPQLSGWRLMSAVRSTPLHSWQSRTVTHSSRSSNPKLPGKPSAVSRRLPSDACLTPLKSDWKKGIPLIQTLMAHMALS